MALSANLDLPSFTNADKDRSKTIQHGKSLPKTAFKSHLGHQEAEGEAGIGKGDGLSGQKLLTGLLAANADNIIPQQQALLQEVRMGLGNRKSGKSVRRKSCKTFDGPMAVIAGKNSRKTRNRNNNYRLCKK